jgi:hypothetical protein
MKVAKLIFGVPQCAPKHVGVELQYFAELEIEVAAVRPRRRLLAVVVRQDLEGLSVLFDNAASSSAY